MGDKMDNYLNVLKDSLTKKERILSELIEKSEKQADIIKAEEIDWDKWLEYNKSVYQVVKDHNDNGKEVYLSEIGWTDNGTTNEEIKVEIANNYKIAYNLIKNELPWITAIFAFRLTNLKTQVESIAEKNFGIFYHPDDEVHKGSPKPAAIEIAKLYNGENYDLLEHLQ